MKNSTDMNRGANLSTQGTKESYVKPHAEVVKMELEQPILNGSVSGDDGTSGKW